MEKIPITGDELTPIYNALVAQMGDPVLMGYAFKKELAGQPETPKKRGRHKKAELVNDVT